MKEELTKSMADFGFMIIQTLVTGARVVLNIYERSAESLLTSGAQISSLTSRCARP